MVVVASCFVAVLLPVAAKVKISILQAHTGTLHKVDGVDRIMPIE